MPSLKFSIMLDKIKSLRTISKSKKILKQAVCLYRQKHKLLDPHAKEKIEALLTTLQAAILQKNADLAERTCLQITEASLRFMPKSTWNRVYEFIRSIGLALIAVIAIRQMWFEFYSIPTGSMRPTLKEGDYLVVSKTDFGINTPWRSGHFFFDPDLVQRGAIVIWSGKDMDMPDDNTMYFYIFPGKKQYVKRLIGKPGDTLYFYGGKIYGIDAEGRDISELRDLACFKTLEHIPFLRFEGKVETPTSSTAIFYQMNEPIAKLSVNSFGLISGTTLPQKDHPAPAQYSDFWGFKHYGMGRLLTKEQVDQLHPGARKDLDAAPLYLEIHHHPSLQQATIVRDEMGRIRPALKTSASLLPLSQKHLDQVLAHMTTARFEVKNERVYRFGSGTGNGSARPLLPGIPDGVYEFQDGRASQVRFGGITTALTADHPLVRHNPAHIQALYNFGIEWSNYFTPSPHAPLPSRYVYFQGGNLYAMNGPILKQGDPTLQAFLDNERQRQAMSTSITPYFPFKDEGAPVRSDGSLDVELIRRFGVTVPEQMYLLLGDNHAMSGDTRQFGFVPQDNLRGGPSFLFWPAGDRWGRLPQAAIDHLSVPNLTIWTIAILISGLSAWIIRRKYYRPFRF